MSWLEREGKDGRLGLGGNRWKKVKSMTVGRLDRVVRYSNYGFLTRTKVASRRLSASSSTASAV